MQTKQNGHTPRKNKNCVSRLIKRISEIESMPRLYYGYASRNPSNQPHYKLFCDYNSLSQHGHKFSNMANKTTNCARVSMQMTQVNEGQCLLIRTVKKQNMFQIYYERSNEKEKDSYNTNNENSNRVQSPSFLLQSNLTCKHSLRYIFLKTEHQ